MSAIERALSQHFLVASAAEPGLVDDYLEACRQAKEPAVIVRLGPPASLTVHLEPTGKRLSEDRRAGLEQLLRGLSAPGAIVLAGPAAGRSDWSTA